MNNKETIDKAARNFICKEAFEVYVRKVLQNEPSLEDLAYIISYASHKDYKEVIEMVNKHRKENKHENESNYTRDAE
jgi:arsenate reductase-like glutaredoxin family protein